MLKDLSMTRLPGRTLNARAGAGAILLLGALALSGCDRSPQARAQSPLFSGDAQVPEVLATVGDQPVTLTDIRGMVGDELDQIEMQYRRARSRTIQTALQAKVRERVVELDAQKRGMSLEQLLASELGGSLIPTEPEVAAWYMDNQSRLGGRSLDELRPQIVEYLEQERRSEAMQKLEGRLTAEYPTTWHFQPFRFELNNEGAPYLGNRNAPVVLTEFSDFECPFCARFAPTLKQLEQEFGDDLKIVYRQLPLTSIHPNAFKAAEASLCANDQGKFWEMHDAMFLEQNRLSVSDIKAIARRQSLDQGRFENCLDSGRYVEQVQNDVREAQLLGVNGTPALFINGVQLEGGAVPFETVAQAIREELARIRR